MRRKRLVVDERIPAAMHRDQQVPFFLGAALRDHAAQRVALLTDVQVSLVAVYV